MTAASQASAGRELADFTADRRMVMLACMAIVLGAVATYVASALLQLIALCTNLFYYQRLSFAPVSPAGHTLGPIAVIVPVLGALIIGAMARWGSERIRGHGIPEALEAILTRGSRIEPRVALLKPVSSAISIGSGGPFGAEGPIIMTGGAIGSLLAQLFSLTAAERKTLLVAGAAAGMSATFATPVAAILLAVELLLFEWKPRSFVPVALASATAAAMRTFVIGDGPLFPLTAHVAFPGAMVLLGCVAAGLGAGLLAGVVTHAVYLFEDLFKRLRFHWMWWPAIGGLVIGLGGLICPQALGVGYDVIGGLLHDSYTARAILVLLIVKGVIWSVSLGSGTSGGVLAPLLMMGGALGGLESLALPAAGVGFWPLVSMAAILGATIGSPLTAIVFAVELTHELDMLLPLVVTVTVAHAFTVLTLKRSILTEKVARRGFHVSREYAIDELEVLFVRDVMRTDMVILADDDQPGAIIGALAAARHEHSQQLYPILDGDAHLAGAATFDELAGWARDPAAQDRPLAALATTPAPTIHAGETLRAAVARMAERGVTRLLAVNPADARHVVGKIALHDLLKARSRNLEAEQRRERILPFEYLLPPWLLGPVARRRAGGRTKAMIAAGAPEPEPAPDQLRVLALLQRHGWNSTSFQILEPGFRYWFASDSLGHDIAVIGYVDTGRAWVAAGAPVGPVEHYAELTARFVAEARTHGRRVCCFATEARFHDAVGWESLRVGDQPIWAPEDWGTVVRQSRSLREQLRRATAKGVTVRALAPSELAAGQPIRTALDGLIARWLASRIIAPMGFLVQVDPFTFPAERHYFVAERDGAVVGFLCVIPIYARRGWFFEDFLRDPSAPNGTVELLVDAAMRAAAAAHLPYVTLGLVPLSGEVSPWLRAARRWGKSLYDFDGLRAFKAKLKPRAWDPIYLAYPRAGSGFVAMFDTLTAFARGGLLRFGFETLLRGPAVVMRVLAALLVLWTALLALPISTPFFPSAAWQYSWVGFDVVLAISLFALSFRWRPRLADLLATAITCDAALTLGQALLFDLPRRRGPLDIAIAVIAICAPSFAALLLWNARLHRAQ